MYVAYPAIAKAPPLDAPTVSDIRFIDSGGQDYAISPGSTLSVQDSGFFEFTTDITGTYSIQIDLNKDGIFGNAGDRSLLGAAGIGLNRVEWDGYSTSRFL